jgi:hypothetical protein
MFLVAALSSPPTAHACGGFFCQTVPVVQSGEQIVYAVEDDGALTMSVRIAYQGEAPEFAWILPVPETPTLSLGTTALFDALEGATRPSFQSVDGGVEGTCRPPPECDFPPPPDAGDPVRGPSWMGAPRSQTQRRPVRRSTPRARSGRSRPS